MTPVLFKFGPAGGTGGTHKFDDSDFLVPDPFSFRLLSIHITSGNSINTIQFNYLNDDGTETDGPRHGVVLGPTQADLFLHPDEHLVKIEGIHGDFVDFLFPRTDKGQGLIAGKILKHPSISQTALPTQIATPDQAGYFTFEAPIGFEIFAVWGSSGDFVDALGVILRPINRPITTTPGLTPTFQPTKTTPAQPFGT